MATPIFSGHFCNIFQGILKLNAIYLYSNLFYHNWIFLIIIHTNKKKTESARCWIYVTYIIMVVPIIVLHLTIIITIKSNMYMYKISKC